MSRLLQRQKPRHFARPFIAGVMRPSETMRLILAFVVVLAGSVANAQEPEEFEIPCANAGTEAVTEVPSLVSDLAAIKCTVYGHLITGADGLLWNNPGAFSPVIIPAQMVQTEPKVVRHEYHFTSVSARILTEKEAAEAYAGFLEGFDERSSEPGQVMEIQATNQLDVTQKVFLFGVGRDSVWGYTCQPTCKPDRPFMVLGPFEQ